jgi:hypothetical protein
VFLRHLITTADMNINDDNRAWCAIYYPSSLNPTSMSSNSSAGSGGRLSRAGKAVYLGNGADASVDGMLATIVLFGSIGLLLWVRCTVFL